MSTGTVEIKITADATEAQKSVKQLKTSMDGLNESATGIGSNGGADSLSSSLSNAASSASGAASAVDDVASSATAADSAAGTLGTSADELGTSMGSLKSSLSGVADKLSTAFTVGAAAAAAGIGAITAKATEAYADYEQLIGGVETLFGSSSSQLVEYAEQAYTTAGLSANEYMEQATSFAASLVSSLGGDTAAAVESANTAMTDMSDNANKMGTDIESIQNAYQGFAKQNYTMLDNLKLGYGGTKTEMERLISDANELKEAQGEVGDLSIDSYADVVEAIHLVQTEMGITGTTAEEAESTISGSVNSMKAAWENWLTALGSEDMDVGEYTDKLLESIAVVLDNVEPAVLEVLESLIGALPSMITGLRDELAELMAQAVADAWEDASESLQEAIGISLPEIDTETLAAGLSVLITVLAGFAAVLLTAGAAITVYQAASAAAAVATTAYQVAVNLAKYAQSAFNLVVMANPLSAVVTLIVAVVAALAIFIATHENARAKVVEVFTQIRETVAAVVDAVVSALDSLASTVNGIPSAFKDFVSKAVSYVNQLPSKLKEAAKTAGSALKTAIKEKIDDTVDVIKTLPSKAKSALGDLSTKLKSAGKDLIQGFIDGIKAKLSDLADSVSSAVTTAVKTLLKLLGISSPSKVFMKYGAYTMEGYVKGVRNSLGKVSGVMGEVADASTLGVPAFGSSYPVFGAAGGGVVNNANRSTNIYVNGIQASPESKLYSLLGDVVDAAGVTNRRRRV